VECRACDGGDYFDDTLKLVFFKTSSLFRVFSSRLNARDEDFGVQKRRDDTLVREKKLLSLSFSLFEDEEFLCHKLLAAEKNKNLCSLLSRISSFDEKQ
jgi:hypothetical protein